VLDLKKSWTAVLGIISILILVISVSGCSSFTNNKLFFEYNLPSGESPDYTGSQNITVPDGTSSVRIDYQNLVKGNSTTQLPTLNIYYLNTVPVAGQPIGSYAKNIVDEKTIDVYNETKPLSGVYLEVNSNIKGVLIVNNNVNGVIKVFVS
jgi:hypothetical protein